MVIQCCKTPSLKLVWRLFFATLLMALLAKAYTRYFDLVLLDAIAEPEIALELLATMTPLQKQAHIVFTLSIDVLYPLTAVAYFFAVLRCAFPHVGTYLALPALLALPIDLGEGVVQVLALTETADLLAIKAWTTPVKSFCYKLAFVLSAVALIKLLLRQKVRQVAD
jgi:hypothetical protein